MTLSKRLSAKHRLGEFGKVLLGELDHRRIDLHLGEALDGFVLEHFLGDAAIAAADDEHLAHVAVGEQRHVRHHLLVNELVLLGDLGGAVEHEHLAEERLLEQHQMLVLGLHLVEHLVDLKRHAEAEFVEQRLGNPAFFRHDGTSGSPIAKRPGPGPAASINSNDRLCRARPAVQASWPRSSSLTPTRFAENASRSTGMHASGSAEPHMNTSSAA